jgi:signal transduction histidine kinase
VLAAALLAVVIALWLSARLTRPIVQLADEAERVKSEFLSTVSHELRTPLTPIRGYADLLRRDRVPRGRRTAYLDEIDEAAGRLERIVMLLVEVAALQGGRFTIEQEPVGATELLTEAASRWRGRSRRHKFVVRSPKSLPRVSADRRTITNVLEELVDNAVKFSPDGGEIELRATRVGNGVKIAVQDQGIGMDPEAVQQLASAFVQAEGGETRRFGGLGLGLTYTSGALAAHGSALEVSAEPDGGATFSFTLPTAGMVARMPSRARST